jgi:hypothetical protein
VSELLTKQANSKKILLYTKIHRYLSYFSAWSLQQFRHLYWGTSFRMPLSNKSAACELSHVLKTFHQLLIIAEAL